MRLASAIRELATAREAPRVAAAFFERTIQIWDFHRSERLSEFNTVFTWGGERIALNPTGELCVAAGFTKGIRGGVACYDALTGSSIWHRTDIRQTQYVRFSTSGESIWLGVEAGPFQQLNARTGATINSFIGIKRIFDHPYSDLLLLATRSRGFLISGANDLRVPNLSFGLLDAACSPDALCLSEAGGPVRCLDSISGEQRWRYDPPKDMHVLRLHYRPANKHFYGILWEYGRGTSRTLFRFSSESGQYEDLCELQSWCEEFCQDGDALVTSIGEVISLAEGKIINRLAFPQKEYPDKITV